MLGSESLEEMFDQRDWSEEDVDEEKNVDGNSESLLASIEKNDRFLPDEENVKDAEGNKIMF